MAQSSSSTSPGSDEKRSDATGPGDNLGERTDVVEAFLQVAQRLTAVGDMQWADAMADYQLLAVNVALRRQLESMRAAVILARQDLGHLSVAFVRASFQDVMYLGFFGKLALEDSQRLFRAMGNWDAARSLLAQRAYVGDEVMAQLWYTPDFLNAVQLKRDEVRSNYGLSRTSTGGLEAICPPARGLLNKPARGTTTSVPRRAAHCTSPPARSFAAAGDTRQAR
jgi:hypothetical protein